MVQQINPQLSKQLQENGKDLEKDQVKFSNLVRFRVANGVRLSDGHLAHFPHGAV